MNKTIECSFVFMQFEVHVKLVILQTILSSTVEDSVLHIEGCLEVCIQLKKTFQICFEHYELKK